MNESKNTSDNEVVEKHDEKLEELHQCACCKKDKPLLGLKDTSERELVCEECIQEFYLCCDDCDTLTHCDEMHNTQNDENICRNCRDDHYVECVRCSGLVHESDINFHEAMDASYCESCYDHVCDENDHESFSEKTYSQTTAFRDNPTAGKIVKSLRPFGVELECHYESASDVENIKSEFPTLGVENDGSLSGNGVEFQTPVLAGKKGEEYVSRFTKALDRQGFTIKKDCGLHVHIDGAPAFFDEASPEQYKILERLRRVWLFYLLFEDVLLSFLPASRRVCTYCQPLKNAYQADEIMHADSIEELEVIWYRTQPHNIPAHKSQHKDSSRYRGINLHSLFAFGRLEVRFHSGTMSAKKINEWVNLHATILDKAVERDFVITSQTFSSLLTLDAKTERFFSILNLSESSKQYFLARQAKFTPPQKVIVPKKALTALLADEVTA